MDKWVLWTTGQLIGRHAATTTMSDKQHKTAENHLSLELMPEEVQRLAQVMLGINPEWTLESWLSLQATMALDLVALDLDRERFTLEQRIHRLEAISQRLESVNDKEIDPHQRNIFDCFDLDTEHSLHGLGARAAYLEDRSVKAAQEDPILHPASDFIELLPDEGSDDPLLAVACQMLLICVESEIGRGKPHATLDAIFKAMNENRVSAEEIDEALDHLLMNGLLIEVDDDCFAPLSS